MLQSAEAIRNISLHEPGRTRPRPFDLHESGVAAPHRPKVVGSVAEPGLVVRLQDEAYDLLQQLVREGGKSERALLVRSFLLDVGASRRPPSGMGRFLSLWDRVASRL